MTSLTRDLLQHLDLHRSALREAVETVPVPARGRQPAPDRWSVAEVLEHLSIVEARIADMFATAAQAAREAGRLRTTDPPEVQPMLDVADLLDRSRKLVAGEPSVPPGKLDAAAALDALERERVRFKDAILAADDLALDESTSSHRRLGMLNMYQWVLFAGAHEGRHAAQIREIAASIGDSAAGPIGSA